MATSNRVFVSPGVYTSEKDLTFVAQSVGVTTLGLVGETLKGPAFEPILITGFDEFKTYFGGTLPEKDGAGNPKYELPYVAKSYLQESNQLFVTRILGLTGYKPVKTFGIKTLGGITVDRNTIPNNSNVQLFKFDPLHPIASSGSTIIFAELSGKTAFDGKSITDHIISTYSGYCNSQGCPDDGKWFTIGLIPDITLNITTEDNHNISDISSTFRDEQVSPLSGLDMATSHNQKEWYNVFFHQATPGDDNSIDGVYSYIFAWNAFWGWFDVVRFKWNAHLNTDYANVVVAALRSRGHYVGNTLNLETTGNTSFMLEKLDDIENNPLGEFTIKVTGATEGAKSFVCSLDSSSSKYVTKVLGMDVFDKPRGQYPLYVQELYPNLLSSLYQRGLVRGLSLNEVYNTEGNNFLKEWDTPISPTVVSEVRGGKVADLFDVITIPDGESANFQVKIMIQNINLETGEFDLIVRDFYDTDENLVVLEKYSRCSMNPDLPGYIAKKIGTSNGDYGLKSKYIMLSIDENAPTDAFPAGFKGFVDNETFGGCTLGSVIFKTEYYNAGDIVYYDVDGTPLLSSGDKVRKVSLGLSSQVSSKYDSDLFKYKGYEAAGETFGFHLSKNAASITGTTYKCTPYDLEGPNKGKLNGITYRKFTFAVGGGFDGWDIYRDTKTYGDGYIFGKKTYVANSGGAGVFSTTIGNSDYYAYLKGILTFSNPEAIDINIFATPGINFYDHSSLTNQAIDMVENDRADSLYIIAPPNEPDVDAIVGDLSDVAIDSNYSATYWPWIQIRDVDNATQLYVPPTGEVCRNIAMTDNISYPWFAVAGYQRGLVKSIKAVKKLTLDDRDNLYKNRINPIATFSDTGTIIWGNKTLQVRESALDRINVRRLLLRARKLISAVSVRLLFEQNDDQVRQEFLRLVNPILESIKKERGLYDFRVKVSNDPEDIDANTLRGKIYIKPTRSLEFIEVEFDITPTGASFDNI